ncbi:MAG: RidA family protein [Clostridia bacterium]|nr:RidA family protein [Clostridia bacterium]
MSKVEERLTELGLTLPPVPAPVAAYVPAVRAGRFVFTSGQLPTVEGRLLAEGRVGAEVTPEVGYQAARQAALNALAAIKSVAGDLDRVERIVKVTGFVASAPGFRAQPQVMNGASELLVAVFGEAGRHARSAVATNELPLGAPVEVELVALLAD